MPNKLYINREGKTFEDASYSSRLFHIQKGHGAAFGDIDLDGDQDIFNFIGGAFEGDIYADALFVNKQQNDKSFINILFVGKTFNRSAIGTRIKISGLDRNNKLITFYHTVNNGGSFGSSSLMHEIGLGNIITTEMFMNVSI